MHCCAVCCHRVLGRDSQSLPVRCTVCMPVLSSLSSISRHLFYCHTLSIFVAATVVAIVCCVSLFTHCAITEHWVKGVTQGVNNNNPNGWNRAMLLRGTLRITTKAAERQKSVCIQQQFNSGKVKPTIQFSSIWFCFNCSDVWRLGQKAKWLDLVHAPYMANSKCYEGHMIFQMFEQLFVESFLIS